MVGVGVGGGGVAGWRGTVLQMVRAIGLLAAALLKEKKKKPSAAASWTMPAV